MKFGPLSITFHRTVRVADGRQPANLPPSLGRIELYEVTKYRERCPRNWEDAGVFFGLHDAEAMWMSFHAARPVALLVGAGAVNALTGKKLGTRLESGNYLVTPPQPWLDGWKSTDGTVFQFVATAYQKGKGNTVAEQIIGKDSKTGGIGLALFEPKQPLSPKLGPQQTWGDSAYGPMNYLVDASSAMHMEGDVPRKPTMAMSADILCARASASVERDTRKFGEMGLGKGGRIIQKVYDDPYGLDAWKELPTQTRAVYIVHAELLAEITGQPIAKPVTQTGYGGPYFGLNDSEEKDVAGAQIFTGLKSVFAEETEETTAKSK
jgi:hypothetical protein